MNSNKEIYKTPPEKQKQECVFQDIWTQQQCIHDGAGTVRVRTFKNHQKVKFSYRLIWNLS